ncbi:YVTN family beta-propeller repeat protein [Neobacillus cucumis]|uniref:YVTN family beta-propeller repeat protein n=1 Tax=Neobacillus cucumis TaxID=1740721 RepID=UPI00285309FF|nr:c-type cytochrome [Neobacillus cucumis]MDR4945606.1 cytochrome D1 domain-containing protein [Neobacillus cucumis]
MKKIWIAVLLAALFTSGCGSKAVQEKTNSKPVKTAETGSFDEKLAGGQLGNESIAFVGAGTANKLWVIDAKYHKLVSTIDVGGPYNERTNKDYYPNLNDTHAIAFTKDFKTLFTGDWYNYDEPSYVIAIDPITMREKWRLPTGKGAHHIALSADDKYLYVANQHDGTLSVIDLATRKKIKDLKTGKGTCYLSPTMYWDRKAIDTPYMFLSVESENKVVAIDMKTNEIVKNISVGGMVHGTNLTPDGKYVWAAVMGAKKVAVIDPKTLEVTGEIKFNEGPIHIAFSPDSKFGYVTTGGNQIYKINVKTHKVVWSTTGTTVPAHVGVTPDGKELWTLNHGMDKRYPYTLGGAAVSGVQVWDTKTGKLITEIVADGVPHEIQFVPYSVFMPKMEATQESSHSNHDTVQAAETNFKNTCASCHGNDLKGGAGPNLTKVGGKYTEQELLKIIQDGKGMMPSNLLTKEESQQMAKWLSQKK